MARRTQSTSTRHNLNFQRAPTGQIALTFGDVSVLSRQDIIIKTEKGDVERFAVSLVDNELTANLGRFGKYTETLKLTGNQAVGEIELRIDTDEPFIVYCPFAMPKPARPPYFMIPGFLYGSNNVKSSTGPDPKFDYGGPIGWPKTSLLYTRSDRSSHPGVITIANGLVFLVGVKEKLDGAVLKPDDQWSPGFLYTGLMLDSSKPDEDIIGFTLGYEHKPQRYSWVWDDPRTPRCDEYLFGWLKRLKGKTLTTQTFYFADSAEGVPDYGKAIRAYYYQLHEPVNKRAARDEALRKMSRSIVKDSWNSEYKFFYLCDNKDGRMIGDAAWTGGMQVAYPLLKAGLCLGDRKIQDVAIDFIDNFARNGLNEKAGLFYEEYRDGKWRITGWWGIRKKCLNFGDNPLHCAYINGQASYFMLKAYEAAGRQYPHWLGAAKRVIETAIASQNKDGAYASFFDPNTGKGVDYDAFQSCWFVPGAALLSAITGDKKYLDSAVRAIRHYYTWHQKGELYGTPMDTHKAVDEEGNLAFICACVELHRVTAQPPRHPERSEGSGFEKYEILRPRGTQNDSARSSMPEQVNEFLKLALVGLDWEFSWKFAYNTAHTNEPLKSMNWSSCGGSITSTHNVHIHPMGNLVAGEIHYLYQQTKDEYIASRLKDTCLWGLGTFNRFDADFGFGKEGQATEQFFHTDGLILPWWKPWDGGVWEAHLPWGPACILLNCAEDIPDSFFAE